MTLKLLIPRPALPAQGIPEFSGAQWRVGESGVFCSVIFPISAVVQYRTDYCRSGMLNVLRQFGNIRHRTLILPSQHQGRTGACGDGLRICIFFGRRGINDNDIVITVARSQKFRKSRAAEQFLRVGRNSPGRQDREVN